MAKEKKPYMPFYGRDFYDDENVLVMNLEQQGAYMRLLWKCWSEGSIPADPEKLAAILRTTEKAMATIWPKLAPCFTPTTDSRMTNRKVEEIREEYRDYCESKSKAAKTRWDRRDTAKQEQSISNARASACIESADANSMPALASSPALAIAYTTPLPPAAKTLEPTSPIWQAFERLIERYPNRIEVDHAAQIWLSMIDLGTVTEAMLPEIADGLTRWMQSDQWTRDDGRYIPSPVKWLRDKRWLDHPPASAEAKAERRGMKRSSEGVDPNAEWVAPWAAEKDVA